MDKTMIKLYKWSEQDGSYGQHAVLTSMVDNDHLLQVMEDHARRRRHVEKLYRIDVYSNEGRLSQQIFTADPFLFDKSIVVP